MTIKIGNVTLSGPYTEGHVAAVRKLIEWMELRRQEERCAAREIADQLVFLEPRDGQTLH